MNEELTIAIEELRLSTYKRAWFIPIKLNECKYLIGVLVEVRP